MFAGLRERCNIEHLLRGARMNIFSTTKCLHQYRVFREMSEDSQLDLGVIRRKQQRTGSGDESCANFTSEFRADRNILQIRIGRTESPGRRAGLAKGGMQATGPRMNKPG